MFWNAFLIALREIRRNPTRAFLTVLGVIIGVAAVITMVTLGRGATEAVKSQISILGSNLLVLRPGQGWGGGGRNVPLFNLADVLGMNRLVAPFRRADGPDKGTRDSFGKSAEHRHPWNDAALLRHRELEDQSGPVFR